jgi:superfamily II DNA helicase RecQ
MMDQCAKLAQKGISACYLDFACEKGIGATAEGENENCEDVDEEGASGDIMCTLSLEEVPACQLIYAHPETLFSKKGRGLLKQLKARTSAIAVDEAHIILEW